MIEITGDLFEPKTYEREVDGRQRCMHMERPDAICITTNGFVKKNGEAVMGRGCAQEARKRWPGIDYQLGKHIRQNGNVVQRIDHAPATPPFCSLVSFPVKPKGVIVNQDKSNIVRHMRNRLNIAMPAPGWAAVADLSLIKQSALDLVSLTDTMGWQRVVLPRMGCGAGELSWNEVSPILHEIMDDRFYTTTFRR